MSAPRKLLLLDSFALAFRMFYAYAKNPLVNKDGLDVSLVHGYWGAVLRILATHKPTHFAIVTDGKVESYYVELEPQPTRLAYKLAVAKKVCDALMRQLENLDRA